MFERSEELRSQAAKGKETERAAQRAAEDQKRREQMTEGERLVEKYQDTVAYLSDRLAAAAKENAWVSADDLKYAQMNPGESFLFLKQYRFDASESQDDNDLVLPIDKQHAESVRELLALPYQQRSIMLEAGFYEEPENESETWKEEDVLDAKHSGITKQLFGILGSHSGRTYQTKDGWYQELAVKTSEELAKQ